MIKKTDIEDYSDTYYLDENPDFANQLLATLNQIDGFSSNDLWFRADSCYWTYDYWISPNYEIEKDAFVISNDQISIQSTNQDDLLNLKHYQQLNYLANNDPIKSRQWSYFPQDRVLQLDNDYRLSPYFNIKLTKAINQYDQKQLNAIGKFMTNVYDLIVKDDQLDWEQFDKQWKQGFTNLRDVGIVFDLNDLNNPKILLRWHDTNRDNRYENDSLKQVLKPEAPLLDYLKQFEQDGHNQLIINQVDRSEQVNQTQAQMTINPINNDVEQLNQPLTSNFDFYIGAKDKTMIGALNSLVKNIKVVIQHDHLIKQWFLSDLKIIYQEEQTLYTISGLLNIIIN